MEKEISESEKSFKNTLKKLIGDNNLSTETKINALNNYIFLLKTYFVNCTLCNSKINIMDYIKHINSCREVTLVSMEKKLLKDFIKEYKSENRTYFYLNSGTFQNSEFNTYCLYALIAMIKQDVYSFVFDFYNKIPHSYYVKLNYELNHYNYDKITIAKQDSENSTTKKKKDEDEKTEIPMKKMKKRILILICCLLKDKDFTEFKNAINIRDDNYNLDLVFQIQVEDISQYYNLHHCKILIDPDTIRHVLLFL